jgi:hypothetical protein
MGLLAMHLKTILILTIVAAPIAALNADEWTWKSRLNDAINATAEARETLLKDLQEADLGETVRSWYTGCPSTEQFAKILEDEKRYNAAARRWLKEVGNQ